MLGKIWREQKWKHFSNIWGTLVVCGFGDMPCGVTPVKMRSRVGIFHAVIVGAASVHSLTTMGAAPQTQFCSFGPKIHPGCHSHCKGVWQFPFWDAWGGTHECSELTKQLYQATPFDCSDPWLRSSNRS